MSVSKETLPPVIQSVTGDNLWVREYSPSPCPSCGRGHCCYFCGPDCFPKMPANHTLCARCGGLIRTPGYNDPMNESMFVCGPCENEMHEQDETA